MPLVTITTRTAKSKRFKDDVLDAVHQSLLHVGVPVTDLFQRVLELAADDFRFDPTYPDAGKPRGDDFVLVEILWSVGRSVTIKKKLLNFLVEQYRAKQLDPEQLMVVFKETQWENWSFAGGRLIHAA